MFGFLIAAVSLAGLVALARGRRYRSPLYWGLRRLDTSPGQEKVIRSALERIRAAVSGLREDLHQSKATLADLTEREHFDTQGMDDYLGQRRAAFEKIKPELFAAAQEIHETLDAEQRRKLAGWIRSRALGFGRHWHAHHCGHHHRCGPAAC